MGAGWFVCDWKRVFFNQDTALGPGGKVVACTGLVFFIQSGAERGRGELAASPRLAIACYGKAVEVGCNLADGDSIIFHLGAPEGPEGKVVTCLGRCHFPPRGPQGW